MTKITEVDPETWLQDYGDYLYRFAYVRLGNKASAEDAVQETFQIAPFHRGKGVDTQA